jgi:hypothetical protein
MLEYCARLLGRWILGTREAVGLLMLGTARGCWTLICMLRRVLEGGLLLSCVATLGYCAKLLGSWMLGAVEKLVCCA